MLINHGSSIRFNSRYREAQAHNYGYTLRSSPGKRASVLGPGTLRKRLISFAFLLRADARGFWKIRSARTAPCCGQICAARKLRVATFVRRNGCRHEKMHLRADLLLPHLKVIVPPRMPLCLASLQSYARQLMSPCAEDLR